MAGKSACAEVRRGDVDFNVQRLHVRRSVRVGVVGEPKTPPSNRVIPLDATLIRELKRWKLACPPTPDKLVFPSASGGYFPAASCSRQLRALLARCGFERPELATFSWHDLRHTRSRAA